MGKFSTGAILTTYDSAKAASGFGSNPSLQSAVGIDNVSIATLPVPEPGTVVLMLAGLGLLGFATRRAR